MKNTHICCSFLLHKKHVHQCNQSLLKYQVYGSIVEDVLYVRK